MSDGHSGGGHGKRRGGHEEEHEEHENHERWLVSYADMMTLLMVLFIVMFAISQVDSKKFLALKTGLAAGFGAPVAILTGADKLLDVGGAIAPDLVNLAGVDGNANPDPQAAAASKAAAAAVNPAKVAELVNATSKAQVQTEVNNLKKAQEAIRKALAAAGLSKDALTWFDERGLVVSLVTDKVLFASGSATLLPAGRKILDAIAPTLATLPNQLSIDGHTDSRPISTAQFPSNWELSGARASGVLRYLAGVRKIPVRRMSAQEFADTRPRVQGTSAKALAANRRVEVVVLARVDNSAGRAVAALGNSTTTTASTSPSATAKATPSPTATPTPTVTHNLLGPDPTTSTTAAPRTTRTTPRTTPRTTRTSAPAVATRTSG